MNIRTLKRIKFVLGKFYRDKICFLIFRILKYFKQYFSFIVDKYIYVQCIMIISTPSHLSYFPETLANTSQYLHFFLTIFITIESRLSLMSVT